MIDKDDKLVCRLEDFPNIVHTQIQHFKENILYTIEVCP